MASRSSSSPNETEHWLVSTVARQAREAGIKMPEVGIYDSPEMNAFATGARRDDSSSPSPPVCSTA